MIVVFFAAGCLEIVSILFRPVSLSFRLYGNIFAGENMLETMARRAGLGWLLPIPFYFLELLVGLVQAMVFMLLTAVFTLLICQHHEEPAAGRRTAERRGRRGMDETRTDVERTTDDDRKLHVGLAALGAAIGVGFIGQGAPRRWDAIPAPRPRSWSSRSWRSPSPKRSCSTRCSWCAKHGGAERRHADLSVTKRVTIMLALALRPRRESGGQIEEIARTFGVDWPHLGAQIVSFGIVCACCTGSPTSRS